MRKTTYKTIAVRPDLLKLLKLRATNNESTITKEVEIILEREFKIKKEI